MDIEAEDIRKIIYAVISLAVGLPLVFGVLFFSLNAATTHTANLTAASNLIVDAAIPWWVGILQSLAAIPVVGGPLALAFILFLKWSRTYDS